MEDVMTISDGENSFQSIHHPGSMNTSFTTTDSFNSGQIAEQNKSVEQVCFKIRLNETDYLPWDNPGDIASPETEAYANRFKLTILPFLFLIGVPANIINMAVFCKQGLKDRVNLCLFSLSLTDELFMIASFCLNAENMYLYLTTGKPKGHWNAFMVNHNLIGFFSTGFISLVLSAIIACERCYCVIRPLKYHTLMRTRTMAVIIVSVFVVLFSLHFIVAFKFRVGCVYDPVTGAVTTALVEGDFYKTHKQFLDQLEGFLFGAGISGGMMIVVLIATIITTVKLRQLMTWRSETTSSSLSSRDVALTKMLIGNSVFFLICASPACLFLVVWLLFPGISAGGQHHNFFLTALWILEGFCYLNYNLNFFIYYVMGSRYRETFWALFGRNRKQK